MGFGYVSDDSLYVVEEAYGRGGGNRAGGGPPVTGCYKALIPPIGQII